MTTRLTTTLAEPDGPGVSYGLADFVAAEEMGRMRGYWWSPDGDALLVARVDDSPVQRWHIADPEHPERPPTVVAYPAAGTAERPGRRCRSSRWRAAAGRSAGTPSATSTWSPRCGRRTSC